MDGMGNKVWQSTTVIRNAMKKVMGKSFWFNRSSQATKSCHHDESCHNTVDLEPNT
jgi:hypothetical protein